MAPVDTFSIPASSTFTEPSGPSFSTSSSSITSGSLSSTLLSFPTSTTSTTSSHSDNLSTLPTSSSISDSTALSPSFSATLSSPPFGQTGAAAASSSHGPKISGAVIAIIVLGVVGVGIAFRAVFYRRKKKRNTTSSASHALANLSKQRASTVPPPIQVSVTQGVSSDKPSFSKAEV